MNIQVNYRYYISQFWNNALFIRLVTTVFIRWNFVLIKSQNGDVIYIGVSSRGERIWRYDLNELRVNVPLKWINQLFLLVIYST